MRQRLLERRQRLCSRGPTPAAPALARPAPARMSASASSAASKAVRARGVVAHRQRHVSLSCSRGIETRPELQRHAEFEIGILQIVHLQVAPADIDARRTWGRGE